MLNSAAELEAKKQELAQHLPPVAAAEIMQLFDRFQNYSIAARQTYPPGIAPASEEDAIVELEGMHALRVAHFGPEVAQAFYGDEEAINRQMIELLRLENDQSLTPEEKAVKAQKLRESLPGIAAIERKNREDDSAPR
ncbi:MAG: hypothetical protein H7Y02_08550 [Candidatus Obscuribacterales bacterium]|nr:hypothetical protein [Steroidobacteraceae bacterium]